MDIQEALSIADVQHFTADTARSWAEDVNKIKQCTDSLKHIFSIIKTRALNGHYNAEVEFNSQVPHIISHVLTNLGFRVAPYGESSENEFGNSVLKVNMNRYKITWNGR